MFVYLLYKYTTDIDKAVVDSVWYNKNEAKEAGRKLMRDKFHVYIESFPIKGERFNKNENYEKNCHYINNKTPFHDY